MTSPLNHLFYFQLKNQPTFNFLPWLFVLDYIPGGWDPWLKIFKLSAFEIDTVAPLLKLSSFQKPQNSSKRRCNTCTSLNFTSFFLKKQNKIRRVGRLQAVQAKNSSNCSSTYYNTNQFDEIFFPKFLVWAMFRKNCRWINSCAHCGHWWGVRMAGVAVLSQWSLLLRFAYSARSNKLRWTLHYVVQHTFRVVSLNVSGRSAFFRIIFFHLVSTKVGD